MLAAWHSEECTTFFHRVLRAPPDRLVTLASSDIKMGARSEFVESRLTGKRKNLLTWLPRLPANGSTSGGPRYSTMLVIGDSYADDIDMGFHCWPTQLARILRLPLINVAQGGAEVRHVHAQLVRAHTFADVDHLQLSPRETLLIIHAGGNDVLHALFRPRLLYHLVADLFRLSNAERRRNGPPPVLAFPFKVSKQIAKGLSALLADVARRGYRDVLVSKLPLCPALPLARALIHALVPTANASFVSDIIGWISASIGHELSIAIEAAAASYSLRLLVFNESDHLQEVARKADADGLGIMGALDLMTRRPRHWLRDVMLGRSTHPEVSAHAESHVLRSDVWHDGHHPSALVHESLAFNVVDLLTTEELKGNKQVSR